MSTTIRARFDGEVLRPYDPVPLPPNTEVTVTIEVTENDGTEPASFLDTALSLRLEGPPDWSTNLDEYLQSIKGKPND